MLVETENATIQSKLGSIETDIENNLILKSLLNSFPHLIGIYDKNYNILFLNHAGLILSGFNPGEEKTKKCFQIFGKSNPCENCPETISRKDDSFGYNAYLDQKDKYICLQSSFNYSSTGDLNTGDLSYITEFARFESSNFFCSFQNEDEQTHITFDSLVRSIPSVVYFKNKLGQAVICNKAFEKFTNLSSSEITGKTDKQLFPQNIADKFFELDQEAITTGETIRETMDFIDQEGEKKFIEVTKTVIFDSQENMEGIVTLMRDVTEHVISEETLKISRDELVQTYEFIHNLMELSPIATLSLDNDMRIITINQRALDALGFEFDELIGVSFLNLLKKPEKFKRGSTKSKVLEFITKDGTSLMANVSQSIVTKEGMDERAVITFQNISDLRSLFFDPLQEEISDIDINSKYMELEAGHIYYKDGIESDESYTMFANMVKSGIPGLCITRQNPERIRAEYGLLKTPFIWLTKNQESGQPYINSSELYKLQPAIYNFIEKVDRGVVFLDGLEYLALDNDIKSVIKAVEEVNDSVMSSTSSMVIHVDSLTLEQKDFHLMTRWMKHIKSSVEDAGE
ncbi:MAG: two-component system, cell cycle response regulator [Methanolobus sp.]|jgi:PAS domain S-box-containing protein|nr:two-component system, cell cycle response regulator [Methanolobus sp.]MDK2938981.1 two-component system, cell cycle response regulator [Methanolobus sp.]